MAQVKFSALVSSVKGKLNGSVFQGCKGLTTLRNKPIKRNVVNTYTEKVRGINKRLAAEWRLLSESQRASWNSNAPAGKSGFNEFYNRNFYSFLFGLSLIQDYPGSSPAPVVAQFTIEKQNANINLILETIPAFPDEYVIISAMPLINVTTDHKRYNMQILVAETTNTGVIEIGAAWLSRYGVALQTDDRLLIEVTVWNKNSGIKSKPNRQYVSVFEWVFYLDTEMSIPPVLVASFQKLISTYLGECCNVVNYDTDIASDFGFVNRLFDYAAANTWLNGSAGTVAQIYNQVVAGSTMSQFNKDLALDFINMAGYIAGTFNYEKSLIVTKFNYGVGSNFTLWCQIYINTSYIDDWNLTDDSAPSISSSYITVSKQNTLLGIVDANGNNLYNDSVNITTGKHDLCMIKEGDNYKLYWDDVLKIDDDMEDSEFNFDRICGCPSFGYLGADARIAHFFIFNGVLTASDRLALKNNL